MRRPGTRVAALLAAVLLLVLAGWVDPRSARACDCAAISTARALRQADAVFQGVVVDRRAAGRGEDARTDLRFRVETVFKGTAYRDQLVATPRDGAGCGVQPEQDSSWVVFATQEVLGRGDEAVSRLVTTGCSGSLATAQPPTLLGPGRPPLEGRSDREESAVNADRALSRWLGGLGIAAGALAVVGAVGLALIWRRPGRAAG